MSNLSLALTESKSLRTEKLSGLSQDEVLGVINKVKACVMAFWQGKGICSTSQIASFYEVSENVVQSAIKNYRDEFAEDDWYYITEKIKGDLFLTKTGRDFAVILGMTDKSDWQSKIAFLENHSISEFFVPVQKDYIYFILDTKAKAIKIGTSKNPEKRFSSLQAGNVNVLRLLGLEYGDRKKEHQLHKLFSHLKMRSEWFKDHKEIREYIASLPLLDTKDVDSDFVWTPRAALRLGMLLRDSQVARAIRDILLDVSEKVPQQSQEIERLKLELELIKAKTYYMDRRDAIAQLHGTPMLALLDGRPDAVVEKVEKVTETIVLRDGRSVSFEGKSTAQVGKELGFRTGKEFERWLDKIGHGDLVCQGLRVNQTPYIPTENLATIKRVWQENRGKTRQLLIGE